MKHIKNIILTLLITSMLVLSLPMQAFAENSNNVKIKDYTDISGSWFEKWVETYGYPEIFSDGSGLFHPDKAITRMEFARMLHKALGININYFAAIDIGEFYSDVNNSDAGASALYDLVISGIIDTKDKFRPSETLKRDEMIHYIMNAFSHFAGSDYAFIEIYHIYADDSNIKSEYSADVQHSSILGLVNGRGDNYLYPRDAATRAEAVTIAGKLAELINKLESKASVTASASEEGGALRLKLTIKNTSDKTVTIDHNSQQLYDFVVFDGNGNSLYCWSANRSFAQVVSATKIEAGKELVLSDTVDDATYATFKKSMNKIVGYITGTSSDFTIDANGYIASLPTPVN